MCFRGCFKLRAAQVNNQQLPDQNADPASSLWPIPAAATRPDELPSLSEHLFKVNAVEAVLSVAAHLGISKLWVDR